MDDARPLPDDRAVDVVLSEERLTTSTRTVEHARVRLRKRVVVEERTIRVQVRREELVVEELPAQADAVAPVRQGGGQAPVLEIVLAEEEIEVVTRVVPRERVRVYVDTVTSTETVSATLAHEEIDVDTSPV